MLAAHPGPTMGSRRSLSGGGGLPFGYIGPVSAPTDEQELLGPVFDFFDGQPPPPAPAPAPGPPVLSSTETSKLTSLLDSILGADNYGPYSFGEGFSNDEFDVPPALEGVSTSYGLSLNGFPSNDYLLSTAHGNLPTTDAISSTTMAPATMNPALEASLVPSPNLMQFPPPIATPASAFAQPAALATAQLSPTGQHHGDRSQYSPDVVEAATVLHNRSHSRSIPDTRNEASFPHGSRQRPPIQGRGPPGRHLRYQELEEFQKEGRRMSQSTHAADQQDTWVPWIFGANAVRPETRTTQASAPVTLQYGTDRSFANDNRPFEPLLEKDTSAALQEHQMSYMSAIELSRSNNTTPGPDAAFNGDGAQSTRAQPKALKIEANGHDGRRPRKSRSGDDDLDDDEEPQSAVSKTSARKRKSKTESIDLPGADVGGSGSSKRRKSSAAVKRENLTEHQKRENHINSEKKRRKVISTGFENLGHIVPTPNGGNASKSAVLESTVLFLQELIDGNAHLRKTYL